MRVQVKNLKKWFPIQKGFLRRTIGHTRAVDGVSLNVESGQTMGLVGESGCGKTTLGRALLRLIEPTSGQALFDDVDITKFGQNDLRSWRANAQMIFQDPFSSLNPKMRIESILNEPYLIHRLTKTKEERRKNVEELLDTVGLSKDALSKFPHEFSGGQRQRIGVARAIAVNPKFIVADEPVSALDVSVQAQIINLLQELQEKRGITFLFVSHDLRVVEYFSHNVTVMYLGKVMEVLPAMDLRRFASHPYTKALLSAIPTMDVDRKRTRIVLDGDVPDPANPPTGCVFHPRCPIAEERCRQQVPDLRKVGSNQMAACHLI